MKGNRSFFKGMLAFTLAMAVLVPSAFSATISGRVTGQNNPSIGLAGYWVYAYSGDWIWEGDAQTNSTGYWAISGVSATDDIVVEVYPEGDAWDYFPEFWSGKQTYAEAQQQNPVDTTNGNVNEINFFLTPTPDNTIEGYVYNSDSQGIPDTTVYIESDSLGEYRTAITDTNGKYTISGIRPADDYTVHFDHTENSNELAVYYYMENPDDIGYYAPTKSVFLRSLASFIPVSETSMHTQINLIANVNLARKISGTVKTQDTQQPLQNYCVYVYTPDYDLMGSACTGDTGNYTIYGLPEMDNLVVEVYPEFTGAEYEGEYYNEKHHFDEADPVSTINGDQTIDFTLKRLPNTQIDGWIHDTDSQGIGEIDVHVFSDQLGIGKSSMTDEYGYYSVKGLPPAQDYRVSIVLEDSQGLAHELFYAIPQGEAPGEYIPDFSVNLFHQATLIGLQEGDYYYSIDIVVGGSPTEGTIEGYVYGPNNEPVAEEWVNAWSEGLGVGNGAFTDATGYYRITGLEPVDPQGAPANGYLVEVWPLDYPYQAFDQADDPENAVLVATGPNSIDFHLKSGSIISGVIKDPMGNPVSDAQVTAWSYEMDVYATTYTGGEGEYSFSLPPSYDYVIAAMHPEYPKRYFDGKAREEDANWLDNTGGPIFGADITFTAGGVIKGRIYIADPDARPLPSHMQVEVSAWSESSQTGGQALTNDEGGYLITGLDPNVNDYILAIYHPGYPAVFYSFSDDGETMNDFVYDPDEATGVAPSDTIDRIFVLPRANAIKGRVTKGGIPVPNIRVEANSDDNAIWGQTITQLAASGEPNYQIVGLLDDYYTVCIYPENGYPAQCQENIQISSGDVTNIDFELGTLSGNNISGSVTGLPIGETVIINAWSPSLLSGKQTIVTGNVVSSSYTISGLIPADDYIVELLSDTYPYQTYDGNFGWTDPDPVDISTGSQTGISFSILSGSALGSISGNVTFPGDATPGEMVWIEVISPSTGPVAGKEVVLGTGGNVVSYSISGFTKNNEGYLVSLVSEKYIDLFYDNVRKPEDAELVDCYNEDQSQNVHFFLSKGLSISGSVTDSSGSPVSKGGVHAWSEETGSGGFAIVKNGQYTISGLEEANDYIVEFWNHELGSFYYNEKGTVRVPWRATPVDISSGASASGRDITIGTGYSITGYVKNINGIGLGNVTVSAWSEKNQAGNITTTGSLGYFEIKGLPQGTEYVVKASPGQASEYLPLTKEDISTGDVVNFKLSKKTGNYTLSGTITKILGAGIKNAIVSVWSESNPELEGFAITDKNGDYEIAGLNQGDDYCFEVDPANVILDKYAFYQECGLSIQADATKDAQLSLGKTIWGKVSATIEGQAKSISGATVHVWSPGNAYWEETWTNSKGIYQLENLPDYSDYVLAVTMNGYVPVKSSVSFPVTGSAIVNFSLSQGGTITGTVKDASTGEPIEGVAVEAYSSAKSSTFGFSGSTVTGNDGTYSIKGLRMKDSGGNTVSDYVVTVYPANHPSQSRFNKKPGDTVNFLLQKQSTTTISGTVSDASGSPVSGGYVSVNFFVAGDDFTAHVIADENGSFECPALDAAGTYQVLFILHDENTNDGIKKEWAVAGQGYDTGAENATDAYQPVASAKTYTPGNQITFRFSAKRAAAAPDTEGPGPVKNLASATHPWVIKDAQGLRDIVQNLSLAPNKRVSSSPSVTVTWDASQQGDDEKYHYVFNQTEEFTITKRNTSNPAISTRSATSSDLSGDNVTYHFHVAVEDSRGRIGQTESLEFVIDTVAPRNASAQAVVTGETSETGNLTLNLQADGAAEMYISNTNFGEGGEWEPYATEKQWKINSGTQSIYIQFKDDADNITNALVTDLSVNPLENLIQILDILAGDTTQLSQDDFDALNVADDGADIIDMKDALYYLQGIAGLRSQT